MFQVPSRCSATGRGKQPMVLVLGEQAHERAFPAPSPAPNNFLPPHLHPITCITVQSLARSQILFTKALARRLQVARWQNAVHHC